jgi:ABC-type phosphate/phosphonate transport system substrate-binding protein
MRGARLLSVLPVLGFFLAIETARAQELVFAVNEGVTYNITPHETRDRYRDLGEMLAKALRRPVRVQPVDQYPVLRKNLEARAYDLAYVHPAHHALRAMRDQRYELVVVTRGFTDYKARFLLKKEAQLAKPEEIRGRPMVMPDPDSITAWMVRATLRDLGMKPETEKLSTTRYQDGIPFMMENGFFEVGITAANSVVKEWQSKGGKVLFESRPVPIKLLIASPALSGAEVERIQTLFLDLDRSEAGRAVLARIGFRGFDAGDAKLMSELTQWLGI